MEESEGPQKPKEPAATGNPHTVECRRGPTWREWTLSILAAIILSVVVTLLLGGSAAFRSDRSTTAGAVGYGSSCCPPTVVGK